jgi:hypothetical protein
MRRIQSFFKLILPLCELSCPTCVTVLFLFPSLVLLSENVTVFPYIRCFARKMIFHSHVMPMFLYVEILFKAINKSI